MKEARKYKTIILLLAIIVAAQAITIFLLAKPKKAPRVIVRPQGRIAIVLDDWGYNLNSLSLIKGIKYPLTISVLPNLAYSKSIAQQLGGQGFEIILHLPLEPHEKFRLERDTIMTYMDQKTVTGILKKDLAGLPYTKGVSGHMGSRATEDARLMAVIFRELKKRNLYFLDSFVSGKSVCSLAAQEMSLRFARRDVFLDNKEEPLYIRAQIRKLKLLASEKGFAIGIGHDRRITLGVLKEVMPELEKEGFKFIFVSELAH